MNRKILKIDGKEIPSSDILAYQNKDGYWAKLEYDALAKRIVQGRINVYRKSTPTPNGAVSSKLYFQKANGPIKQVLSMDELKEMIRDCPKAYNMLNVGDDEYRKALKRDPYFNQTVIETYNACGEWK